MVEVIKASCVDPNLTLRGLSAPDPWPHTCVKSRKLYMIRVESLLEAYSS